MTKRCRNGHELNKINLYTNPNGTTACRVCTRESGKRYRDRLQAAKVAQREAIRRDTDRAAGALLGVDKPKVDRVRKCPRGHDKISKDCAKCAREAETVRRAFERAAAKNAR